MKIDRKKAVARVCNSHKTVRELSKIANIHESTYYRVLKTGNCSLATAGKIAFSVGCNVNDILPECFWKCKEG